MNKKMIADYSAKLDELSAAIEDYRKKIAALTYDHVGPLTEAEAANLQTYREERTNLHGIVTGIWLAAAIGNFEDKLTTYRIVQDVKKTVAREQDRFQNS